MSSMFKKRGGLAFKPKVPLARARPAAPASQPPKPVTGTVATTPASSETTTPTAPDTSQLSIATAQTSPTEDSDTIPPVSISASEPEPTQVPTTTIATPPATQLDDSTPTTALTAPPVTHPRQNAFETSQTELNRVEPQPSTEPALLSVAFEEPAPAIPLPSSTQTTHTDVSIAAPPPEVTQPTPRATPRSRSKRSSAATPGTSTGDENGTPTVTGKRRRKTTTQSAETSASEAPARKRRSQASTENGQARTPRRARSLTPEDAENQVVDLQKLKMADLTRDLHIGKKFSRHDELRERERQARLKSKLRLDSEDPDSAKAESAASGSNGTPVATPSSTPAAPSQAAAGPQFRIVDGQIVLDQSSLLMDRHARAAATQGDMELVEENDFTRLITSSSFMTTSKLRGPNIWTPEETELFYKGLRMFGTDFEIISKMFPGKQRRHVKLKFNREERHCPKLIDAALIGEKTTKIDLDEYKSFTGSDFESVESIEAQQRKVQEDFEAQQKRIVDEQEEIMRKKREELFADDDDKDAAAKKKKKRRGKHQFEEEGRYGEVVVEEVG